MNIVYQERYIKERKLMDFVIAKEALISNEPVYSGSVQQAIDCDITLPEYCPDILRILKCQLIPRVSSHNLNSDRLNIDGSGLLRILYIDEKDASINSYEQICTFSRSVDIGYISDSSPFSSIIASTVVLYFFAISHTASFSSQK